MLRYKSEWDLFLLSKSYWAGQFSPEPLFLSSISSKIGKSFIFMVFNCYEHIFSSLKNLNQRPIDVLIG